MSTLVLLVEDNEMNRDMLSRRLRRRGYTVEVAVDGEEAVQKCIDLLPAIVLMDLSLPVMDGWTATRMLKSNATTTLIPIIALTAHAMHGDREKALDAGCDEYETKPVNLARLLEKMASFLG